MKFDKIITLENQRQSIGEKPVTGTMGQAQDSTKYDINPIISHCLGALQLDFRNQISLMTSIQNAIRSIN